jgi:hypothetical protein
MGFTKAADTVRWAMAWSALMAGFVWLFARAWLDPAARGERRERATFLKRILPLGRKRAVNGARDSARAGRA